MRLRRSVAAVLGTLSALAGAVMLAGYAIPSLPSVDDFIPSAPGMVVIHGESLIMRIFDALFSWGLTAAAFYMAFRLFRFLNISEKRNLNNH